MIPLPALSTWLELALKGAVVLATAAAAVRALRGASAATRHLVWAVALAALVALPLASAIVPRLPVSVPAWAPPAAPAPAVRASADAPSTGSVALAQPPRTAAAPAVAPTPPATRRVDATTAPIAPSRALLALWLLGAVALVARTLAGQLGIGRMLRSALPLADRTWTDRLDVAASEIGCRRAVRVLMSPDLAVPVTCGIVSPAIVVPADARTWDDARARVVLLHELAHVRRHDCLVHLVASCAVALHWMNPLAWVAASRLRSERERACDDLVLAAGTSGPAYAAHLLDIARGATGASVIAASALAMARPSELEGRLLAVLDRNLPRATAGRNAVLGALFIALTSVSAVAAVTLQPPDVEPAQASAPAPTPAPTPAPAPSPHPAPVASGAGAGRGASGGTGSGASGGVKGGVPGGVQGGVAGPPVASAPRRAQGERTTGPSTVSTAARENAVQALVAALKDESPDVRQQAMQTLVEMRSPAVFEPMLAALSDPNAEIRQQAVMGLAQLEDKRAAPALIKALADSDAEVRHHAAFALGQLEDATAVPALVKALGDADAEVREQAAFALGRVGSPSAVPGLVATLNDANADVRKQAAFALGCIGDAGAVEPLTRALKDKNPEVRQQAAFAIGRVIGEHDEDEEREQHEQRDQR